MIKKIAEESVKGIDIVVHTAAALPLYKPEDIFQQMLTEQEICSKQHSVLM